MDLEEKPRTLARVIVKVNHIRSPSFLKADLTNGLFYSTGPILHPPLMSSLCVLASLADVASIHLYQFSNSDEYASTVADCLYQHLV